jgi:YidC/Oxa1 family membrane protein insertase
MEKRAFIAFIISILVILLYPYWLKKISHKQPYHKVNDTVVKQPIKKSIKLAANDTVPDTVIESDRLSISLNKRAGIIKRIIFREKLNNKINNITLYSLNYSNLGLFSSTVSSPNFNVQTVSKNRIILKYQGITKEFSVNGNLFKVNIEGENEILLPFEISLKGLERRYARIYFKTLSGEKKVLSLRSAKKSNLVFSEIDWIAVSLRYYTLLFDPEQKFSCSFSSFGKNKGFIIHLLSKESKFNLYSYIGPNSLNLIKSYNPKWADVLNYGKISKVMFGILQKFYLLTHSYGLSIILLSILINLFFYPITRKSFKNMREMQKLQPQITTLRQKYKDDPQSMNKEMLLLYKKYKINPMSGCLPMFFQIPVFWALYSTLMRAYELKGAKFLWIKDLAQPDKFLLLPKQFPIIGSNINLLPILMGIFYWFQMRVSPASKTTQNSWLFPLIFAIIFYNFPAGLVLYWLVNSLIMIPIQGYVKK